MREIKFRAYMHKRTPASNGNFMIYSRSTISIGCLSTRFPVGEAVEMPIGQFWANVGHFQGEVSLMQFTEILDKKGLQLYESDIIEGVMASGAGHSRKPGKKALFEIIFTNNLGWFPRLITKISGDYRAYPDLTNCTKVGNIYQEPELLK